LADGCKQGQGNGGRQGQGDGGRLGDEIKGDGGRLGGSSLGDGAVTEWQSQVKPMRQQLVSSSTLFIFLFCGFLE
jgi:hypothetical protein